MMAAKTTDCSASGIPELDLSKILRAITENRDKFSQGDDTVRGQLLADVRRLNILLETSAEAIMRMAWADSNCEMVLRKESEFAFHFPSIQIVGQLW